MPQFLRDAREGISQVGVRLELEVSAARLFGNVLERAAEPRALQADRVHHESLTGGHLPDGTRFAGAIEGVRVVAVRQHEDHPAAGLACEGGHRRNRGAPQRREAAGPQLFREDPREHGLVSRQERADRHLFSECADARPVAGCESVDEPPRRLADGEHAADHAAAHIQHDCDGNRLHLVRKVGELDAPAVVEHLEGRLPEVGNQAAAYVRTVA